MCELDSEALERATQEPVRAIHPAGVFDNIASIFEAAIKRERAKQAQYQRNPDSDPPEAA